MREFKFHTEKVKLLKEYFEKEPAVILAFLFGSRAKGYFRDKISDWDVAVYFEPKTKRIEIEEDIVYPQRDEIWGAVEKILQDEVDLVVLNRVPADLVFSILNSGLPLCIKTPAFFLELLLRASSQTEDFGEFMLDFWKIKQRAKSIGEEERRNLIKRIDFGEDSLNLYDYYQKITKKEYQEDVHKRGDLERWIENLVNVCLDISKIILSSEKTPLPYTYREVLEKFGLRYFDEDFAKGFCRFAKLRNILAHEYLDIRWQDINDFVKNAKPYLEKFLKKVKEFL